MDKFIEKHQARIWFNIWNIITIALFCLDYETWKIISCCALAQAWLIAAYLKGNNKNETK